MDVFKNIENGCEYISGLNSLTNRDEILKIVVDQPCVSAVSLGRFKITYNGYKLYNLYNLRCVVRMVVDSVLPHTESGPNGYRKDAPRLI